MWRDEIVEEVRKVREEYAAKFDYNLNAIYKDIKEEEKKTRRKVVSLPPRKPELFSTEKSPELQHVAE